MGSHVGFAVSQIMTKPVITIECIRPIEEAVDLMAEKNLGSVVVTDFGKPAGIVTERDIIKAFARRHATLKAEDVMSHPLVTVSPDIHPIRALEIMTQKKIRRLPVVDDGRLVGIVTQRDLVQWIILRPEVLYEILSSAYPVISREVAFGFVQEMYSRSLK